MVNTLEITPAKGGIVDSDLNTSETATTVNTAELLYTDHDSEDIGVLVPKDQVEYNRVQYNLSNYGIMVNINSLNSPNGTFDWKTQNSGEL